MMHNVRLVDVSNELSKTEIESLKLCAHHLKRLGEVSKAGFDLQAFHFLSYFLSVHLCGESVQKDE